MGLGEKLLVKVESLAVRHESYAHRQIEEELCE